MEKIIRVKNKYIFYNEKKEVLILCNGWDKIFVPGLIEGQFFNSYNETIKCIINLLTNQSEKVYLNNAIREFPIFKTENAKLKKTLLYEIKNYFSCYANFTEKICTEINKLCFDENMIADLIYMDDLKQIIQKKDKFKVDRFLLDSLEELEKRLTYKKY